MKVKIFTRLTLFIILTLTLSGIGIAQGSQPTLVEKRDGLPPFATPEGALQQMTDSQAQTRRHLLARLVETLRRWLCRVTTPILALDRAWPS